MIIVSGISVDAVMQDLAYSAHVGPMNTTSSRVGECKAFPEPVCVQYMPEYNMWSRNPHRDANPFFHFVESLWMLAGKNHLGPLVRLVKNFSDYSDDGMTVDGAYGHRWRYHFGVDQLMYVIQCLKDISNRRAVMMMWDPQYDVPKSLTGGRDVPCNIGVSFHIMRERLQMTVFNRSNDLFFGMLGANAVHFGMLQRYVAAAVGCELGSYHQVSTNCHVYSRHYELLEAVRTSPVPESSLISDLDMLGSGEDEHMFRMDLATFFSGELEEVVYDRYRTKWFQKVAAPVLDTYLSREPNYPDGSPKIYSPDLYYACRDWITRREV